MNSPSRFLFICSLLFSPLLFGQTTDSIRLNRLQDMGYFPYPTLSELAQNVFPDSLLQITPLSQAPINESFTNTGDLFWLKDIAIRNKVIFIAEEHYHQAISDFRTRILFYLNTIDHYPLLVQEAQYSYTPYFNYYINLPDDREAESYYSTRLYNMVGTEDEHNLLTLVRTWNKRNPTKKITLGFSDIEHDFQTTIKQILIPYFRSINDQPDSEMQASSFRKLGEQLPHYYALLEKAKEVNLIGEYPFITPLFISCVLRNLESTYKAYYFQFDYYRQKAIVRNLTDPDFLGSFLISGKAIIHGGNYHATTHFNYPDDANFYREGSYLSEDFLPTKRKVYSISFHSFSRSLGQMAHIDVDSCLQQGSYYISLVKQMQKAFKEKLVKEDEPLFDFKMNDLHRLIMKKALQENGSPFLVRKMNWDALLNIAVKSDSNLYNDLENWENDYSRYDAHVFIPNSPFVTAVKRK